MNIQGFMLSYPPLICTDYGEAEFASIRTLCPGLSSPKLGKILNFAGRFLEPGEIYLEIGTFTGYTLIAASHHNTRFEFWGIDNMRLLGETTTKDKQDWVRGRLKINLDHFKYGNHHFIEDDYKDVTIPAEKKIGVFLIDGHHTKEEVIENFMWVDDKLADEALIAIDDISCWGVGDGVDEWVHSHRANYREFFRMNVYHPPEDRDHWSPAFWNGLSLVSFKRKG
jgi:predicted O-methyltransferase YrrM